MIRMFKDKEFRPLYIMILVLVACIVMTMALVGCKTKYVMAEPQVVEVPRIEHHYQNTTSHDTIFQKDSTIIFQRGDTIYNNSVQHHYHSVYLRDTVSRNDTITVVKPVNVPYPVEKSLTFWERTRMKAGSLFIILLIGLLGVGAFKLKKKFKP